MTREQKQDVWLNIQMKKHNLWKISSKKKMRSSYTHRLSTRDAEESTKTWEPSQQKQDLSFPKIRSKKKKITSILTDEWATRYRQHQDDNEPRQT